MTNVEFKSIQERLGLTDRQTATMLGFENHQHVARLKAQPDASHAKRVMPQTARLMRAYRDGYRPDDWPTKTKKLEPPSSTAELDVRDEFVTRSELEAALEQFRLSIERRILGPLDGLTAARG